MDQLAGVIFGYRFGGWCPHGQRHSHNCSPARGAVNFELTLVKFHQTRDNGQSKTAALEISIATAVGLPERFPDMFKGCRLDADAPIADLDLQHAPELLRTQADVAAFR